jgi:hypothetical protein
MPEIREFNPFYNIPVESIWDKFGDWITLLLFVMFFIAVAGIALEKRFGGKGYFKPLIISLGLMMAGGMYMARETLKFSLASFGFLAYVLLILMLGTLSYLFIKSMGWRPDIAFCVAYCGTWLTFQVMSPSIYDALATSFPIVNWITLLFFVYLGFQLVRKVFGHKLSPTKSAQHLRSREVRPPDYEQIMQEIDFENKERKFIKKNPIRLTNQGIHSIKDMDRGLMEVASILRTHEELSNEDRKRLARFLRKIGEKEADFTHSLGKLDKHVRHAHRGDAHKLDELKKRYAHTKDEHKKKQIHYEYEQEKKKIEVFQFVETYADRIRAAMNMFNERLAKAVEIIERNQPAEAFHSVAQAHNVLQNVSSHLAKMLELERSVVIISKQEQHMLSLESHAK